MERLELRIDGNIIEWDRGDGILEKTGWTLIINFSVRIELEPSFWKFLVKSIKEVKKELHQRRVEKRSQKGL